MFGYKNWGRPVPGGLRWGDVPRPYTPPSPHRDLPPVQLSQYYYTYPAADMMTEDEVPEDRKQNVKGGDGSPAKRRLFGGPRRKRQSPVNIYATNTAAHKPPLLTIPEMVSCRGARPLCQSVLR